MAGKITDIHMGQPYYYQNSFGDTWDPAWAANDAQKYIYAISNNGYWSNGDNYI